MIVPLKQITSKKGYSGLVISVYESEEIQIQWCFIWTENVVSPKHIVNEISSNEQQQQKFNKWGYIKKQKRSYLEKNGETS